MGVLDFFLKADWHPQLWEENGVGGGGRCVLKRWVFCDSLVTYELLLKIGFSPLKLSQPR